MKYLTECDLCINIVYVLWKYFFLLKVDVRKKKKEMTKETQKTNNNFLSF